MTAALFDVDGVLADFLTTVLRHAGLSPRVSVKDITQWDVKACLSHEDNKVFEDVLTNSDTVVAEMDVMPGAVEAVEAVRKAGFDVVAVTSPWISNKTWEYQRRGWLKKHFGIKSGDIISASAKYRVDGLVLVDDKPEHVKKWTEHRGKTGILFRHQFNASVEHPYSIRGWEKPDVNYIIQKLLNADKTWCDLCKTYHRPGDHW